MSQPEAELFSCIGCKSSSPISAEAVLKTFSKAGYSVQPVRAAMVFGMDHVRSACLHAQRSFERGNSVSDDIMTEVAHYVGCNRQLTKSLQLVKVDGDTEVVLVTKPPLKMEDEVRLLAKLGLERDDSVADVTRSKAGNARLLGIRSHSMDSIREEVLERIALLEVER